MTQMMGIGSYVGEIREGPDGQLYEWAEGVDGLGNPIGFWKSIKRIARKARSVVRPLARAALPYTKFIPGAGTAIYAAGTLAQRGGVLGIGDVAEGTDGQLYEWVEGVDGLGNPIGFWKKLKKAAGGFIKKAAGGLLSRLPGVQMVTGVTKQFCRALPQLQPCVQQIPGARQPYNIGTKVCGVLRKVGLAGAEGEIMEAPDGQLYEVVEGIGASGEPRKSLRRVRLIIPAYIGSQQRRIARPGCRPVRGAAAPGAPAPAQTTPVNGFGRFY